MPELPVPDVEERDGISFSGRLRPVLAFGGVFSGVALLLNILAGVSLGFALAVMTALLLAVLGGVLAVSSADSRRWMLWTVAVGIALASPPPSSMTTDRPPGGEEAALR
jgi:hypothetical protein